MKLLYKPFSILSRVIASRIGKTVYRGLWSRIDEHEPPAPTASGTNLAKVLEAAVLEAATMAAFGALADRASATAFQYLFGVWPGERPEEKNVSSALRLQIPAVRGFRRRTGYQLTPEAMLDEDPAAQDSPAEELLRRALLDESSSVAVSLSVG